MKTISVRAVLQAGEGWRGLGKQGTLQQQAVDMTRGDRDPGSVTSLPVSSHFGRSSLH